MTRSLPPQSPVEPPRYRFRLPGDSYHVPRSLPSPAPVRPDPSDGGDWLAYRDDEQGLWARLRKAWLA